MALHTANQLKELTKARSGESGHWLLAGHWDPDFVEAVCASIAELGQLRPGWDGYGAPAIDPSIIASAQQLIRALPGNLAFRPRVVPLSTGSLQFEWHQGKKVLELEFETPDAIRFLQWHPEQGVEEEETFPASDTNKVVELIQWFMSGTCV
jgi:hypothetical protein